MSTTSKATPQFVRVGRYSDAQGDGNRSPFTPSPVIDRDYTVKDIQDRLAYTDHALPKISPIRICALRLVDMPHQTLDMAQRLTRR